MPDTDKATPRLAVPSKATRAGWREKAVNTCMVSAVGEYTPQEFVVLLDAVDALERQRDALERQRDALVAALRKLKDAGCAPEWPEAAQDAWDRAVEEADTALKLAEAP